MRAVFGAGQLLKGRRGWSLLDRFRIQQHGILTAIPDAFISEAFWRRCFTARRARLKLVRLRLAVERLTAGRLRNYSGFKHVSANRLRRKSLF
jgi:hypothetical protein